MSQRARAARNELPQALKRELYVSVQLARLEVVPFPIPQSKSLIFVTFFP